MRIIIISCKCKCHLKQLEFQLDSLFFQFEYNQLRDFFVFFLSKAKI